MGHACSKKCDGDDDGGYDGAWYGFPPLRNALIAGVIAGLGLILGHLGIIPGQVENLFFLIAIPIGAYHWAKEGFEDLIHEHAIDIEMLMIAATLGAIGTRALGRGRSAGHPVRRSRRRGAYHVRPDTFIDPETAGPCAEGGRPDPERDRTGDPG